MSKAIETAQAWVATQPEDVQKAYEAILANPTAAAELGGNILRQADYTQKTMEVSQTATENADFRKKLMTWQERANVEHDTALKQVETLKNEKAALTGRLSRIGTKFEIPEDELQVGADVPADEKPPVEKPVANLEELHAYADKTALNSISVTAKLFNLARQHDRLGIEEEFDPEALITGALDKNQSVEDYFSQTFDVKNREQVLADKVLADREATIRADERAQVQSEMASDGYMPGASSDRPGSGSPLLALAGGERSLADGPGDNPDRGVQDAVAAFNKHLYENGVEATPSK